MALFDASALLPSDGPMADAEKPSDLLKNADLALYRAKSQGRGRTTMFTPDLRAVATYNDLYAIYRRLHDAFGNVTAAANLGSAMKDLLAIRAKATA